MDRLDRITANPAVLNGQPTIRKKVISGKVTNTTSPSIDQVQMEASVVRRGEGVSGIT